LGARVGITGRDIARTRAAAAEVAMASGNPAVDPFPADMSSQAEVRRLAGEVLAAYPRLDVLVNNVGGFWATRQITPTVWSARSRSTTWPRSCSPGCSWTGSRPAPRPGW
jgi:NAD(P)-dependent dehydrogenase (short-subunit alcohol dehydrogenase family)